MMTHKPHVNPGTLALGYFSDALMLDLTDEAATAFADLRALLAERDALKTDVERLREALTKIIALVDAKKLVRPAYQAEAATRADFVKARDALAATDPNIS